MIIKMPKQIRPFLFKWLCCFATPLVLVGLPFIYGNNFKRSFQQIILKPQQTGISTLNFYDEKRDRPLTTEIWYPVNPNTPATAPNGVWLRCNEARNAPLSDAREKYPLIVLSHGSGGDRFNISWLAEVLAANGYIVAAVDHFGNTWNNKIPECYAKPWDRPQDISFVLDELLNSSPFKDRIALNQIGFAGYSLGGATGIWIAGAQASTCDINQMKLVCEQEFCNLVTPDVIDKIDFHCACQSFIDKRISAMFIMAPALGWLFDEESLQSIQIPIYIIAPEKDEVVPIDNNARIFAKKITRASLKVLSGDASHFIFLNQPTLMGKRFLDARYWKDPENIDREKIHQDLSHTAVIFFSKHLK